MEVCPSWIRRETSTIARSSHKISYLTESGLCHSNPRSYFTVTSRILSLQTAQVLERPHLFEHTTPQAYVDWQLIHSLGHTQYFRLADVDTKTIPSVYLLLCLLSGPFHPRTLCCLDWLPRIVHPPCSPAFQSRPRCCQYVRSIHNSLNDWKLKVCRHRFNICSQNLMAPLPKSHVTLFIKKTLFLFFSSPCVDKFTLKFMWTYFLGFNCFQKYQQLTGH